MSHSLTEKPSLSGDGVVTPSGQEAGQAAGPTPGPWSACQDGRCTCGLIWDASGNIHVASAISGRDIGQPWHACDIIISDEEQHANARLIAAAPTMRDMVIASAHSVCSAAAYPNTSIEQRWLRDRWLAALDALGLTEEQARAECRATMRGIYAAAPAQPTDAAAHPTHSGDTYA